MTAQQANVQRISLSPRKLMIALLNIVSAGATLYAASLIVYLIARLLVGERWSGVELGNNLMPALILPLVVVVLLGALRRHIWMIGLCLPAFLFFIVQYGALWLPGTPPVPPGTPTLRVLTFNLATHVTDPERIAAVIRQTDADVVAVQELLDSVEVTLTPLLADRYPYLAVHPGAIFAIGVGVYSRFPILDDTALPGFVLAAQRTRIQFNGQPVTVLNAHPPPPSIMPTQFNSSLRRAEIAALMNEAAAITEPLVILGDFNVTDQADDYHRITVRYRDAFREAGTGLGPTFPASSRLRPFGLSVPALIRIDYIFYSPHWQAIDAYVVAEQTSSDHYGVVAVLARLED